MAKKEYTVVSLGGSLISGRGTGGLPAVEVGQVGRLARLFLRLLGRGQRFVVIAGGGALCRQYNAAAERIAGGLKRPVLGLGLHWMGIYATRVNAALIRAILSPYTPPDLLYPIVRDRVAIRRAKCVVGGGVVPGPSSDFAAMQWAHFVGAHQIVNCTNIDFVYTADPRKHKDARPLRSLSWGEYLKIVGRRFKPGGNYPFDPKAAILAQKLGVTVKIVNGSRVKEVERALTGQEFRGTILHP